MHDEVEQYHLKKDKVRMINPIVLLNCQAFVFLLPFKFGLVTPLLLQHLVKHKYVYIVLIIHPYTDRI